MFGIKKTDTNANNGVEDWGSYMAAKKSKLEDQYQELVFKEFQNATNLLEGVAIFVNGWTDPPANELRRLMMEHGGIYHNYLRPSITTHLIASNLPYSKIIHYRKSKNPLPLCKPQWITDSIKANKLLDWRPYLLYSSTSVTQPQLQFKNIKNPSNDGIPSEPGPSTQTPHEKLIKALPVATKTDSKREGLRTNSTALCSKNEEFLTEFYNNSRLHHIATMGATFKDYVNELRSKCEDSFPGLERLKKSTADLEKNVPVMNEPNSDDDLFDAIEFNSKKEEKCVIMHIDMDCFFVSVGLRNRPELKGLPVAVTHARGKKPSTGINEDEESLGSMAEIASCSYEARKAGLKNGMFLGQALKLCPNLKTIKYDFEGYKEVSYTLYNTIASYTLDIEAVSCDEMYADISKVLYQCNLTPLQFADIIRNEIKEKTGCPVSTGFGNNKLQARLATKLAKPDGQFYLEDQDAQLFIGNMNVRDIPGVGYTTMNQLKKMNVRICSDLIKIPLAVLQKEFGKKTGEMLYNTCRGIDSSKLNIEHVRKSVSSEVNYGIRFKNDNDANEFLKKLSREVVNRLTKVNAKGRCITLKLMVRAKNAPIEPVKFMGHGVCDNYTKSKNLFTAIDDEVIITKEVLSLWEQLQQPATEIRGIGIQISRLETLRKKNDTYMMKFIAKAKHSTFDATSQITEKTEKLQPTVINNDEDEPKSSKQQDFKTYFTTIKNATPLHQALMHKSDNNSTQSKKNEVVTTEFSKYKEDEIDESVLNELPLDIRNEILASKNRSTVKSKKVLKTLQSQPENYFKEMKIGKNNTKLPEIEQLDMKVLIELPDDIRNEILNHYKSNQNEPIENTEFNQSRKVKIRNNENHNLNMQTRKFNAVSEDFNISFSQIDPDFLSALPKDMKDDVKLYCMAKKKERLTKTKKKSNGDAEPNTVHVKPQNLLNVKKRSRKIKVTQNNIPILPKPVSKIKPVNKINKNVDNDKLINRSSSFLENEISILQTDNVTVNDRRIDIRTHRSNFRGNTENSDEHQEMLTTLVNYLFSLPMHQIKKQIETWISKSNNVNEIDVISIATFLSMLPKERRIEDLHILMRTMHRCMTEMGSCVWHETYSRTVEHVQHYMQIEYKSNLMLPPIRCNFRECKSNHV